MAKARKTIGLTYNDLISPVFMVLQALGGSGTVKEINDKIIITLRKRTAMIIRISTHVPSLRKQLRRCAKRQDITNKSN